MISFHRGTLETRRAALAQLLAGTPALVASGHASPRNYRANTFPFRAASHFLYLVGRAYEDAWVLISSEGSTLFLPDPDADDALWHGALPGFDEIGAELGLAVRPQSELAAAIARLGTGSIATLPSIDAASREATARWLGRPVVYGRLEGADARLADAMIALRLRHDEGAVRGLEEAARITTLAHAAGMRATKPGLREWHVRAAMLKAMQDEHAGVAYEPIVTVHGEVLHHRGSDGRLAVGDLILADVGAETDEGWAGDVTRAWPVSGRFSDTQRAIYDVVLESQRRAITKVAPGVRYRDVHLEASLALTEGLLALGIFRGASASSLVELGAHAIFFPHGVGHLIGLDVHDMEDLGDRAGYAPSRTRSTQFGTSYLRLDRDLASGMAVTIEPGFYFVPALIEGPKLAPLVAAHVDRDVLARYADVRGIRIEDDVLVTETGARVLTSEIPKTVDEVERAMRD